LNYDDKNQLKREFSKELEWFYDELIIIFKEKHNYNKKNIDCANKILDIMSQTLNKYAFEDSICLFTDILGKIEIKYPKLFKEVNIYD